MGDALSSTVVIVTEAARASRVVGRTEGVIAPCLFSSPFLWSMSDSLSTQRFVMQVLVIRTRLLQMNHKANLMKQSTQK